MTKRKRFTSEQTYHRCRKEYGGMNTNQIRTIWFTFWQLGNDNLVNGDIVLDERIELRGSHDYWDPAGTVNKCYGLTD